MSWFMAEHAALLAAVYLAAGAGFGTHAWQLASTLSTFFLRRGSWQDNALAQQAGLDAARRMGDVAGEAQRALRQFEMIGDGVSQARIHNSLTWLAEREQRLADALSHATRALDLYRAAEHRPGQAMVLNDIGFCDGQLGKYQQAITYCEQALAAHRELGERNTQHSAGDIEAARRTWTRALRTFDDIDHSDGDQVRAKLNRASRQPEASSAVVAGLDRASRDAGG
jgi:tetratricopeptide (TPR) repeat protein